MKIREELFDHPDWWQTKFAITDLNETNEEFEFRVKYLILIETNLQAVEEGFFEEEQFDYETIDEYRARIRQFNLSIDLGVNEKHQDGYYLVDESIKKDMLGSELPFNKDWYSNYLKKSQSN